MFVSLNLAIGQSLPCITGIPSVSAPGGESKQEFAAFSQIPRISERVRGRGGLACTGYGEEEGGGWRVEVGGRREEAY